MDRAALSRLAPILSVLAACGSRAPARDARPVTVPPPDAGTPGVVDAAVATAVPPDATPTDRCALVTAADLHEVCGYDKTLVVDPDEGKPGHPRCDRDEDPGGFGRFGFTLEDVDPTDTHRWADSSLSAWGSVSAVALGDRAELVHNHMAMESETITLYVERGGDALRLHMFHPDFSKAACTDAELTELGRRAVERL